MTVIPASTGIREPGGVTPDAPGSGFGRAAEGFMRVALTVTEERIAEAVKRLARLK